MNLSKTIRDQFHRPTGLLGIAAGAIMAKRPSNRRRNEWVVDLLDPRSNDNVLEIGFGPGYAIGLLAQRCLTGRIVGVDHSPTMIARAARVNRGAIDRGLVDLQLGTIETLAPPVDSFDKVLSVNTWHFWENRVETLRQIRSFMRPGGLIAIAEQPRSRNADDEMAVRTGRLLARELAVAGFHDVRVEQLEIRPVMVICCIGVA